MALNIAVVGLGGIGNRHATIYDNHAQCNLVAVCDIDPKRADAAATRYGAKAFYAVRDMLDASLDIDIASVATAGHENGGDHYAPTMELLDAGIHVLGEKTHFQQHPRSPRNGRQSQRKEPALRHRPQPPVHARCNTRQGMGG